MPRTILTMSARRAWQLAHCLATNAQHANAAQAKAGPSELLLALFLEESRAHAVLAERGVNGEQIITRFFSPNNPTTSAANEVNTVGNEDSQPLPAWLPVALQQAFGEYVSQSVAVAEQADHWRPDVEPEDPLADVLRTAGEAAGCVDLDDGIGSEHLLFGLAAVSSPVGIALAEWSCSRQEIAGVLGLAENDVAPPIPTDIVLTPTVTESAQTVDLLRILDAVGNRLREGLRVVEDFVRFVLDDQQLTTALKQWRHELREALSSIDGGRLLTARDTAGDVGTQVTTNAERSRASLRDVLQANLKRCGEATRSLEEFSKLHSPEAGSQLEQLRYRFYDLEKAILQTVAAQRTLADRPLYLLLTSENCRVGIDAVLQAAVQQGVSIVQLREKTLPDRELLALARRLQAWCRERGVLFIVNDRPDIALLADADGVHVGQDELTVRDARRIIGCDRLVGVSTHSPAQARQAVLDGADYLGVGPVFKSPTKNFDELAGLEFVEQVAAEITRPWYAIGGITQTTLPELLQAGATRIAVSSAICAAVDPAAATRTLRESLR